MPTSNYRPPLRFRLSLRSLLLLTAIAAVCMGIKANAVRRQQQVVAELSNMSITVYYDHLNVPTSQGQAARSLMLPTQRRGEPAGPSWLRSLIGDDYFENATAVAVSSDMAEIRAALPHLKRLPHLQEVFLSSGGCGLSYPNTLQAKRLIERELPGVKVTLYALMVVG